MEVLLLQDISGVGKKNDLLVVRDGFALNNLLPCKKALVATPTVRKRYAEQIKRRAEERQQETEKAESTAEKVSGTTVKFERKLTKTGKLYAAITEKHIADALKEQHNIEVESSSIECSEPIKSAGESTVVVHIAGKDTAVTVVVEEATE